MAEFDLKIETERFCNRITSGIRNPNKRQEVKNEYKDFIEDNVHSLMLEGENCERAFYKTVESLGNELKLTEMLASVNNEKMPSFVRSVLVGVFISFILSTYFWIDNSSFRSYYVLILQLTLLVFAVVLLYNLYRYTRAFSIRRKALKKLNDFSKQFNCGVKKINNPYTSIFKVTDIPELTLETKNTEYVIKLWTTIRGKKTLRLMSNGLYSYSDNVGYMNLLTNPKGHILTGGAVFCPPNINYYQKFANSHSEMVEVYQGMHLMPDIKWEVPLKTEKKTVRILLLNPIPYSVVRVENGVEKKHSDGDLFCGYHVFSVTGLLSFLKGEFIK